MVQKSFKDISLSTLGLGNMRLPQINPHDPKSPIDYSAAYKIMDLALESGINYFDTAYVYNNGDSERCVGEWLKKQDRDSVYIATKFNIGANPDYKAVFAEQLERLQTDHIDFYLIHCLMNGNYDQYVNSGAIEYFLDMKKQGKITYLGFSSHADPDVLEKFADHHDWDFAQLQINYFDWLYGTSKEEYEILASRDIPVIVMEPVRGGRLAVLTPDTREELRQAHPEWTTSAWALRFVRSLPAVQVVLSGMSNLEQVEDNVKTFSDTSPFTEADREKLFKVCADFKKQLTIPCTGCRYCTEDCPMQINIPEFLKYLNAFKAEGKGGLEGIDNVETQGKPADCIACGACMGHCPQNIQIPDHMAALAEVM